jgi:hypothetical protein
MTDRELDPPSGFDRRRFWRIFCHFCSAPAEYKVHENAYTPDGMYVCGDHKYTAYS